MTNELDLFDDLEDAPLGGPKVGIAVVAVASFLVGVLLIANGIYAAQGGHSMSLYMVAQLTTATGFGEAQTGQLMDALRGIKSASTAVALILGVMCLVAGVGVALRRAWGRILALILGLASNLLSLLALAVLDLPGTVLYGSYALLTLLILRDRDYQRQFR